MKRKILILIPLLMLLSAAVYAATSAYLIGVVGVVSEPASEEPAAGTVIFGTVGTVSGEIMLMESNAEYYTTNMPLEAAWTESSTTTTISKIKLNIEGLTGGSDIKVILRGSDKGIIAQTSSLTVTDYQDPMGVVELTFASPPTVTKGNDYYMSVITDTDFAAGFYEITSSYDSCSSAGGTFASPQSSALDCDGYLSTTAHFFIQAIK